MAFNPNSWPLGVNNMTPGMHGGGLRAISPEERQRMGAALNKKLGPEFLTSRQAGGGTKVNYIEGWRAISIANEVFGFDGWSTEVRSIDIDFVDYNEESHRWSAAVSATVRVTIFTGTYHEDVGIGKMENAKSKGDLMDKIKKEAVTDGLKRCLRMFGNLLGNCIYDKEYLADMRKMKAPGKVPFNIKDVHRQGTSLFPPIVQEEAGGEQSFQPEVAKKELPGDTGGVSTHTLPHTTRPNTNAQTKARQSEAQRTSMVTAAPPPAAAAVGERQAKIEGMQQPDAVTAQSDDGYDFDETIDMDEEEIRQLVEVNAYEEPGLLPDDSGFDEGSMLAAAAEIEKKPGGPEGRDASRPLGKIPLGDTKRPHHQQQSPIAVAIVSHRTGVNVSDSLTAQRNNPNRSTSDGPTVSPEGGAAARGIQPRASSVTPVSDAAVAGAKRSHTEMSISKPMPQVPRPDIPAGISPVERSRRLREQAAVAGRNNDQAGQSVTDPARQDQFRAQREEAILKRQKMEAAKNSCSRGSSG